MNNQTKITKEILLYGIIFFLAGILRFILLGKMPLIESEASEAFQAWQIWKGESIRLGSMIGYLSLTEALFSIFGSGNFVARFWPALVGSFIIWIPYYFRDRLGRITALVLASGLALDPAMVSLSRIADSPIPALVFLLLFAAAFHHHRLNWSLIFLFLALFSGPAFWFGAVVLGAALVVSSVFGYLDLKEYVHSKFSDIQNTQNKFWSAAGEFFLPALVVLGIGSFFFSQYQGLSAWMASLPEFLMSWITPSGVSALKVLAVLVLSNPLINIFGILGFLAAWRQNDQGGKIFSLWFGFSLLLVLIFPGRETADLIWVVVPLWVGAAKELVRLFQIAKSSWVVFTLSGMVAVLITLNWLTLTGMIFQQANQRAILLQWGLIAASLALALLVMTIVGSEWGWPSVKKGFAVGSAGMLAVYMFSAMAQGAFLSAGDPKSFWTKALGSGQVDLLLDSIKEVSVLETGRWDSIQGAVINGNATLKWALREFIDIKYYDVYDPSKTTPVLITREVDNYPVPLNIYRGQDFVISSTPAWTGVIPEDWISWLAFRDGPIDRQDIILWVRQDILAGGE